MTDRNGMVLHVIDTLRRGGAERVLLSIVRASHARGERVGVCLTRCGGELMRELPPDVPVLKLERRTRWDLNALSTFALWAKAHNVALFHAHGRSSTAFAIAVRALFLRGTPILMHDHFGRIHSDNSIPLLQALAVRFGVNLYVAVSGELQEWALSVLRLPKDRVTTLLNGVDADEIHSQARIGSTIDAPGRIGGRLRAVLIANLRAEKAHDVLVKAIGSSSILREKLIVDCWGEAPSESEKTTIKRLIADEGLEETVLYRGATSAMLSRLGHYDFGIVASHSEAGPLCALEYMASGLPYVTTRVGSVVVSAEPSGACLSCEPGDDEALRASLEQMIRLSQEERLTMGEAGRTMVRNKFGISRYMDELDLLYRIVLSGGTIPTSFKRLSESGGNTS